MKKEICNIIVALINTIDSTEKDRAKKQQQIISIRASIEEFSKKWPNLSKKEKGEIEAVSESLFKLKLYL